MKRTIYYLASIAVLTALLVVPAVQAEAIGWQAIAPGIDYQAYTFNSPDPIFPGPVRAFVARMQRSNTSVTLDSAIANDSISGSRQKMTDMAAIYDEAINYWGQSWGKRNHVVVAINGGFFDLGTGVIQGGQVQGGWYTKRFGDFGGGGGGGASGFAWKLDRSAFMGQCVNNIPEKQRVTYPKIADINLNWMMFEGINLNPSDRCMNQLILYTPQYGKSTPVHSGEATLEVVVEMTTPDLIKPTPNYAAGIVRELHEGSGSTLISYDAVVLSAGGTARDVLIDQEHIQVGDEILISQELSHYSKSDCSTPAPGDWSKTYASIDGNKIVVYEGAVPLDLPVLGPDPRTAIAFNNDYVYFIVVDGRRPGYSIGLDLHYLGQFAMDTLGATWAINQDGGGSSTMVINDQVMNLPSDCRFLYLPFVSNNASTAQMAAQPDAQNVDYQRQRVCQRPVANGMLMVQVEDMLQSNRFTAGDAVITNQAAVLRLGPGSNYPAITTIPAGTSGVILADINNLGGILAKGFYRWKIDIGGGIVGWVAEETLDNQ